VTIIARLVVLVSVISLGGLVQVLAQAPKKGAAPAPAATPAPAPSAAPAADGQQPPAPGWVPRCGSVSRDAPLECAIEESAVLKTGQLVTLVNIRVPSDTRAPVALVQLPLGISLPAGAKLQIDEGKMYDVQLQTCEQRGCYGNLPVAPDMLAALRSGKQLKVSFQNLAKESIAIPLPLADFAAAYDKIK
jgi:invasion protein IalB